MTEHNHENEELEEVLPVEEANQSELENLEGEYEQLEDRFLRVQAELANIQKRNAKERQDAAKYRSQNLATSLLPALDSLEKALETEVEDEKAKNLKKGVEMVYNLLVEALEKEGVEMVNPLNEPFDPNYHMAIQVQPAEEGQAADTVVSVMQKGYRLNDRILRPAMVVVAQ
ncbi:nucleotide exchange factor GrpE [Jeotgalibaca caeni]|uniref:nucleotide exchange factor GrpE n=1 Tax=Jeotgalibaca caeni TaxID=3028623 RepID=UPI00237DA6B0|nr:nucleotide exchange factor GrpE [Jeotgalibaca caeni]MDE1549053.1 nucleotide exchange factor GrpE [Jeotgalibaca caeni]